MVTMFFHKSFEQALSCVLVAYQDAITLNNYHSINVDVSYKQIHATVKNQLKNCFNFLIKPQVLYCIQQKNSTLYFTIARSDKNLWNRIPQSST